MDNPNEYKKKQENFRKRFLASGLENFTSEEKLEFLLQYGMPYKDTSDAAKKIINSCGSLSAAMDAPINLLAEQDITTNAAILIKMIPHISRVFLDDKQKREHKNGSLITLEDKIITSFIGIENEQVEMVLFDKKGKEVFFGVVSKGSITASEINIRNIVETAIRYHAREAYIAHNHPSGIPYPSDKDIDATIRLRDALDTVNIRLCDHFVIADSQSFSMANNEEFFDIFLH